MRTWVFLLFSDSIVIFSEHFGKVKNAAQAFYTWGILQDFWLRGAIAQGNVTKFDLGSFTHERKIILPFLWRGVSESIQTGVHS